MKRTSLLMVISLSALLALVGCQHQGQETTETETQSNETIEETSNETQDTNTQETETTETTETTDASVDMAALIETGQQLAAGCVACHTTDGSESVGPTWLGLYGSTKTLSDDSTVVADDAYLKESILDPAAKLVKDYSALMPPYSFEDEELDALIAYIQSLAE